MDIDQLVLALEECDDDQASSDIIEVLQSDLGEAEAILRKLATSIDVDLRLWVPWLAANALSLQAIPILEELLDDENSDVRNSALEELAALNPTAALKDLDRIREMLRRDDPFEPVRAMWMIADHGVTELRSEVEELRMRSSRPPHQHIAGIVLSVLDRDDSAIIQRIVSHEHELMPELARAAVTLRTPRIIDALNDAAQIAPDAECAAVLQEALNAMEIPRAV